MEFELTYLDVTVLHISYNTTGTPTLIIVKQLLWFECIANVWESLQEVNYW